MVVGARWNPDNAGSDSTNRRTHSTRPYQLWSVEIKGISLQIVMNTNEYIKKNIQIH